MKKLFLMLGCIAALSARHAYADDMRRAGADQGVALFAQGCLQFLGGRNEVRAWMNQRHVPEIPAPDRNIFIQGRPGIVYNASNRWAILALVSDDNNLCSVFSDKADRSEIIRYLEAVLQKLHVKYKMTKDHFDPRSPHIHHRDYIITHENHLFNLIISTSDFIHLQAEMTIAPRSPEER